MYAWNSLKLYAIQCLVDMQYTINVKIANLSNKSPYQRQSFHSESIIWQQLTPIMILKNHYHDYDNIYYCDLSHIFDYRTALLFGVAIWIQEVLVIGPDKTENWQIFCTHVIDFYRPCHIYIFSSPSGMCVSTTYKSNATSAIVARNPILHCVINNTCWLLIRLILMK